EIIHHLELMTHELQLYIAVIHLDNLIKGGRISHAMGRISSFLNLKLVLKWTADGLDVDTKGRGLKSISKRIEQVVKEMKEAGPLAEIGISHVGLSDYSLKWIEDLKQHFPGVPFYVGQASPVLMAHAGKEAFALYYLPEKLAQYK